MTYFDLHHQTVPRYNLQSDLIRFESLNLTVYNHGFKSKNWSVLPNEIPRSTGISLAGVNTLDLSDKIKAVISQPDQSIDVNQKFRFSLFVPTSSQPVKELIILTHGLNERDWKKYLPWAAYMAQNTGQAVLLFPIAFHMNRAPSEWANPRRMDIISAERCRRHDYISHSSFANAAISMRLQQSPQRFFWSGLQSYRDLCQLIREIKQGCYPPVSPETHINFFGYSMGAFLCQIILMTNPDKLLTDSRLFIFCGGTVLDRLYPVSKYILDSQAHLALYAYFIHHLEQELQEDRRLRQSFNEDREAATFFQSLLQFYNLRNLREERFNELKDQISAVGLAKDHVAPPFEMINTIKGAARNIPVNVKIENFNYDCSHENPFPYRVNQKKEINKGFEKIFKRAANHLSS